MIYPEHIQWIIDNRTEALNQALSQDNSYKIIDNPLDIFLDADPSSKKKLTQWLVDTYINGGFRWEDMQSGSNSKVFDTLSLYIKHKSKLDSLNHIGQYDNLGSVYKDIAPFIKSEKSSRSVKRDEQTQAYEESEVLIKSDSLTVVIPKTEYASKWWGKGTQWCTAGDKNNIFERYNKNGPLIIIIVNGVKTQLHVDLVDKGNEIQFMDEHDNPVELNFIEENWKLLSPIVEWIVRQNGDYLYYAPEDLRTLELCLEAVRSNGGALHYVPEALRTAELCLEAVKNYGKALGYTPKSLITPELCLVAVRSSGGALSYIPKSLITPELCLEAIRQNGMAFGYTPKSLITPELCLEAVRSNGETLRLVPEHLITPALCLEAVKNNSLALAYVPKQLKTPELCL